MNEIVRRAMPLHDLKTARLRLVAMTQAMLHADLDRDGSLGRLLRVELTMEWPPVDWEPHVVRMTLAQCMEHSSTAGWHRYVLLAETGSTRTLIGCVGGFLKSDGMVELGYSILPAFQRRGYATEAVSALVQWMWQQDRVRSITAQADVNKTESVKVMERCGLRFTGVGDEQGTVRYVVTKT